MPSLGVHAQNGAAALGGDIGHDIAEVRVGDGYLEQADRLKDGGLCLGDAVLICKTAAVWKAISLESTGW